MDTITASGSEELHEELKHLKRHRVLEALAQRLLVSLLQE
jgi:hypothetical protein